MNTHPHLLLVPAIVTALAGAAGPLRAADIPTSTCSQLEPGPVPWNAASLLERSILESGATPGEAPPGSLDEVFPFFPALTLEQGSASWHHRAGTGRWQNLQGIPFGPGREYGRRHDASAQDTSWRLDAARGNWSSDAERVAGGSYALSRRIEFSLTYKSLGVMDNAFSTDDWVDRSKTHSVLAIFKVKF